MVLLKYVFKKRRLMPPDKPFESQGFRLLQELFCRGKRVFEIQDIKNAAIAQKIPLNQLKKIVSNLAKHGRLLRLRRGIYVGIGLLPEQTKAPAFVISAFLIQPSVISHWSALQHHGLTEQVPHTITASTSKKVITPSMRVSDKPSSHKKHAWVIDGIRYEYITIAKEIFDLGIETIWIPWAGEDGFYKVKITDKERTLLDMFNHPKIFGGIGEALGVLENALGDIDIEKLVHYAIKYNKKFLVKRLGWALESFNVEEKYLKPLLAAPIHHYCRLDPSAPAIGPCNKRWMIQDNLTAKNK